MKHLTCRRVDTLLQAASRLRMLVVGDVMLDHFIWGRVRRISPEAPVPVVEFERENFMPGGAANVARNLAALGVRTEMLGVVGRDEHGRRLRSLLEQQHVSCQGIVATSRRITTRKVRIVAQRQQVARVDRESPGRVEPVVTRRLLQQALALLPRTDAVIVGDYGKGVVTQALVDGLRTACRARGVWLSVDPKPVHRLDLAGLSLLTPNRKETFELAELEDSVRAANPLMDPPLLQAAAALLKRLQPALLLVTLGEAGMLLCRRGGTPHHIPTVAREVFDVSGAGDTVIASFTLAVAAGASPLEAAMFSNHAAGVVVGKVGTAVVTPAELRDSFCSPPPP